jgi:hypothetical protein
MWRSGFIMTDSFSTLHGNAALDFIAQGLTEVSVDHLNWAVEYIDESTGISYLLDYPHPGQHGGGEPRLTLKTGTCKIQ